MKIINDYGSFQNVANEFVTTARQELVVLSEKEIISKISIQRFQKWSL